MLLRVTVVATLYSRYHVGLFAAFAVDELVVSDFDTLPTFVTIHGIETTDDRRDMCAGLVANALEVRNEALTATRVGVTAVHETVYEGLIGYAVLFGDLNEFEEVLQRTVYTAIGAETHDMQFFALRLCSLVSGYDLRILHDRVVTNRTVDLHEVLINDATGTDIEVSYFRVTHLSVGQTYILSAGL